MTLAVHCTKGTYIRTLVEDIGEVLGCGAHVTALRRLTVGPYKSDAMVTLTELEILIREKGHAAVNECLCLIDSALGHWEKLEIAEAAAFYLRRGQPIILPYAPSQGWLRLYVRDGRFLGIGEVLPDGRVAPRRLLF